MNDQRIYDALSELAVQQKKVADVLEKSGKKEKDRWDKFAILSTFLATVIIAVIGSVFTYVYNSNESARSSILKEQEVRIARIQTLEKFITHLAGSENEKQLAILAISSLGDSDLATKLAALYPSTGTVEALKTIASSGHAGDRELASTALQRIFDDQRRSVVQLISDQGGQQSFASGAIVSASGHVITADYAVAAFDNADKKTIHVVTADNKTHEASVLAVDKERGLAVLQVSGGNYSPIQLGTLNFVDGSSVLAIGTRGKLLLEPATGIVRGADGHVVKIAFATEINGFGGGPVLNTQGLLIAVVHSRDGGNADIDRCIRSEVIRDYLKELGIDVAIKRS